MGTLRLFIRDVSFARSLVSPCIVIKPVTARPGRDADLNSRRGHEIVHRLQNITAPSVFNPRAFYDGKKNLFSVGPLKMQGDAAEVKETPLSV